MKTTRVLLAISECRNIHLHQDDENMNSPLLNCSLQRVHLAYITAVNKQSGDIEHDNFVHNIKLMHTERTMQSN